MRERMPKVRRMERRFRERQAVAPLDDFTARKVHAKSGARSVCCDCTPIEVSDIELI
jgi:hypothetical protein